jgi:hypothetical protein
MLMSTSTPSVPSSPVKEGQTVKFIPRDANLEARAVPYYDFYTNLSGTVAKLYCDGTAAVIVDRGSLPDDAHERHVKSERDMRDKWMKSLSEEDRGKLTEVQKQFSLRYTLLVTATDLIDIDADMPVVLEKNRSKKTLDKSPDTEARPTEEALLAAEEAHLEELRRTGGSS